MLKGFIDLVFCHHDRYYLIDYKSNRLGNDNSAYSQEAMRREILDKRYDLQYMLYLLALHRQLQARLGADYDYERHIGGAIYVFVRGVDSAGHGVFIDKPTAQTMQALQQLFSGVKQCC
ncbi:MAG: PD-(D/E)XK nuclease family protein, partial [Methylococcales bacterium]